MWIPFDSMPAEARVWIYQANRVLEAHEIAKLKTYFKAQIDTWNTHGTALKGSAEISYSRFILIAVDEGHQAPSGCSIDKSTHWVKEIGQKIGVDFFDRSVSYLKGQEVVSVPLANVKQSVNEGVLRRDTIIFNTTITQLSQVSGQWMVPAEKSWMGRYFSKILA